LEVDDKNAEDASSHEAHISTEPSIVEELGIAARQPSTASSASEGSSLTAASFADTPANVDTLRPAESHVFDVFAIAGWPSFRAVDSECVSFGKGVGMVRNRSMSTLSASRGKHPAYDAVSWHLVGRLAFTALSSSSATACASNSRNCATLFEERPVPKKSFNAIDITGGR